MALRGKPLECGRVKTYLELDNFDSRCHFGWPTDDVPDPPASKNSCKKSSNKTSTVLLLTIQTHKFITGTKMRYGIP